MLWAVLCSFVAFFETLDYPLVKFGFKVAEVTETVEFVCDLCLVDERTRPRKLDSQIVPQTLPRFYFRINLLHIIENNVCASD